jgi:hypothetical protein
MVRNFTDSVIALVARYRGIARRDARGWLVVPNPDEVEDLQLPERRELEDRLRLSLLDEGRGSIVYEREIADLPNRFRELFEAQA